MWQRLSLSSEGIKPKRLSIIGEAENSEAKAVKRARVSSGDVNHLSIDIAAVLRDASQTLKSGNHRPRAATYV